MIAVVETKMESSMWTAFFTAVTPLIILFSLWVQRIWELRRTRIAEKTSSLMAEVKDRISSVDNELRVSVSILKQTSERTTSQINGYMRVVLRNMAALARNHAVMSANYAKRTNNEEDKSVARVAELAAIAAENEYKEYESGKDDRLAASGMLVQTITGKDVK